MDYSGNRRVWFTISHWRKSQNLFESCWEENVSAEKPEASFLYSTPSWIRIPLLDTLTYLHYLELVWKSMHTHVTNTWLTSFMLVVYVSITLVLCQSKHTLAQAIIQHLKKLVVFLCRLMTKTKLYMCRSPWKKGWIKDANQDSGFLRRSELSCIPRSRFASHGSMLPYMDKSKLLHILRALYRE